jgi:hypothetical protein
VGLAELSQGVHMLCLEFKVGSVLLDQQLLQL